MATVTTTIDIAASPQEVWNVIMDPERAAEWVTIHRAIKRHDDGPPHDGYKMTQRLCIRGVPFDVHWELAELVAPWHATWEGTGPARSRARIVDQLSERDGGTHFEYLNEFRAPLGPLGAVASSVLVGGVPRQEADASLAKLKSLLEAR